MIIEEIKKANRTISDVAKELGISTSQIYRWNREGIKINNPHWKKIKEMFPNIEACSGNITAAGTEDKRGRSNRLKVLRTTETSIPSYTEPKFKSVLFPNIKIKQKKKKGENENGKD